MRISYCESKCTLFRYIPCLPKSKDAQNVSLVAVVVDQKPLPEQKIERVMVDGDEKKGEAEAVPRSSLKNRSSSDSKEDGKGNVKWLDFLGKDLAEIREFEPSESGESQDDIDGNSHCTCVIQ